MPEARKDYFRRDQRTGISPPDLLKDCTFAEHIVHARGKRTRFTSISLDPAKIRDMGETTYRLRRQKTEEDGHKVLDHEALLASLIRTAQRETEAERARAIQALRYARRRKEGLVDWGFDISSMPRKEVIPWAEKKVQAYFARVS